MLCNKCLIEIGEKPNYAGVTLREDIVRCQRCGAQINVRTGEKFSSSDEAYDKVEEKNFDKLRR